MAWNDIKDTVDAAVVTTFGAYGIYTSIVGITVDLKAVIEKGVVRVGFDSELATEHDEIAFRSSDIYNPMRGDTFYDGVDTYEFVSVISDDGQCPVWLVKRGV